MRCDADLRDLDFIAKMVREIQARQSPGWPMFYAMEHLHTQVRQARNEISVHWMRPCPCRAPCRDR